MLYVYMYRLGTVPKLHDDYMWNAPGYFDLCAFEKIMMEPFAQECVKAIDKSTVIAPRVIDSPVLGSISPRNLSGGCKTVLCMRYFSDKYRFDIGRCGENAIPWIVKAAEDKDVHIYIDDKPLFNKDCVGPCVVENTGEETRIEKLWDVGKRLRNEGII